MKTQVVRDMDKLPAMAAQWDELLDGDPFTTVFQTREWITAWWEAYGRPGRMLLLLLTEGETLIGIAPLVRRAVDGEDEIVFIGQGRADYLDFIAREADRPRVTRAVLAALHDEPDWSLARLRNIAAASPTALQLPAAARECKLRVMRDPDEVCPALLRGGPQPTPDALLRKYRVRRAGNVFRRMGRFEVIDLDSIEAARAQLPDFFDQHVRRWQGTETPSLFRDPANRAFYERMVEHLFPTGRLLFSVARLDDRPIAYHFGFDSDGRVFWYKPSFEPDFAPQSPGTTLLEHLIRHVVDHGRKELDFTVGAEPFKQRYANAERRNANFRVFRERRRYLVARSTDLGYRGLRWIARRTGLVALLRRRRTP